MTSFPEPFYRWRPHPWHGLETGRQPPEIVTAFIEISPRDVVKYEVESERATSSWIASSAGAARLQPSTV